MVGNIKNGLAFGDQLRSAVVRPVVHGFEVRFRERVVIGDMGTAVSLDDTKVGQQQSKWKIRPRRWVSKEYVERVMRYSDFSELARQEQAGGFRERLSTSAFPFFRRGCAGGGVTN